MKKVFTLSSCTTSKLILKKAKVAELGFEIKDVKMAPITEEELSQLRSLAGSYEALFSRRSQKYKSVGLSEKILGEADYKALLLSEYTFLKRPVILDGEHLFIGNSKATVEALLRHLNLPSVL
jgi:arsenate reductase